MLEGMFGFEVALKRFGLSYFAMPIPQSPLNTQPIRR